MPWVRLLRAFDRVRRWRIFAYATLALAGLAGLYEPPSVLASNAGIHTARFIAAVWLVGGLACAVSVLRRGLGGEVIFLRVLSGSFVIFALTLFWQARELEDARIAIYGAVMVSFAAVLWAMWSVVQALAQFTQEVPHAD